MKRAVIFYSLAFICLAVRGMALGQSNDVTPCPFNIIGTWKSEATTQSNPVFFSFTQDGWVTLLGHSADALPQDFEMITQVRYKLDKPAAPKNIEFITARGNDIFQPGVTMMKIVDFSDDSFTTTDQVSQEKTRWVKEKTHRYFLTFAARSGPLPQGGPAFAMWTVMDGRNTQIKALGVQIAKDEAGKMAAVFGPIPAELYEQIKEETDKDKAKKLGKDPVVIARFELTQTEFDKTHKLYQLWEKNAETKALPHGDPYLNGMEFLSKAAEGLNPCGEKARLQRPTQRERDEIASKYNPAQHQLEYIKVMRKKNEELHVTDGAFPWGWRPSLQVPGH
jgi:hypothetical protein